MYLKKDKLQDLIQLNHDDNNEDYGDDDDDDQRITLHWTVACCTPTYLCVWAEFVGLTWV